METRQDPNRLEDIKSPSHKGSGWEYPITVEGHFNFLIEDDQAEISESSTRDLMPYLRRKPEKAAAASMVTIRTIKGALVRPIMGVFA